MFDTEKLISDYSDLIEEHHTWLTPFGKQRLDKWEELLKANSESAICEAATRRLLSKHGVKIEPYEDISYGGPDFLCLPNSKRFYIEVTCITIDAATRATGLVPNSPSQTYTPKPLTRRIFYEMCNKVPQLRNLDAPSLLAIGTLHDSAGHISFSKEPAKEVLTSTPKISVQFDIEQGRAIGEPYLTTDLQYSGFVRQDKNSITSIEDARKTISALLLCSFGTELVRALGVLHPNPNHAFDRTLLPQIEFCRLAEGYQTGPFTPEWI
ncbi:MAG: hypothetical protein HQ580_14565 [Planctomycetes bacterium]|nr:hypothetical protein [Planctomycetota bacterium]